MKMNALIMAGGRGERLKSKIEKPMLIFKGKPMIDIAIEALEGSRYIGNVHVATTEYTGKTEANVKAHGTPVVRVPGKGYVADMRLAMRKLRLKRALVMSADTPLITARDIDFVLEEYQKLGKPCMAVMVPVSVFEEHGITPTMSLDGLVPSAVNIVYLESPDDATLVTDKLQFAVNINTRWDLEIAQRFSKI